MICWKCVVRTGKHLNHEYEELAVAFEKYKNEISSFMPSVEEKVVQFKAALLHLDANYREISSQQVSTEVDIHSTFKRIREALVARETELVEELKKVTLNKLKSLALQKGEVMTILAQLSSCLDFMEGVLKSDNKQDALMMKANTVDQVEMLTSEHQTEPCQEADLAFSTTNYDYRKYGQLIMSNFTGSIQVSCHRKWTGNRNSGREVYCFS